MTTQLPSTRISTGFTAATAATEVVAGQDLTGLRALVTGAAQF